MGVWGSAGVVPWNSFCVRRPRLARDGELWRGPAGWGTSPGASLAVHWWSGRGAAGTAECQLSRSPIRVSVAAPGPEQALSRTPPAELSRLSQVPRPCARAADALVVSTGGLSRTSPNSPGIWSLNFSWISSVCVYVWGILSVVI